MDGVENGWYDGGCVILLGWRILEGCECYGFMDEVADLDGVADMDVGGGYATFF